MSEWRGLHNPKRHETVWSATGSADCLRGDCGELCTPHEPCRCCLEAEVERLTKIMQRVFSVLSVCDFEVDRDSDGDLLREPIAVVPVHNVMLALRGETA